MIIVASELVASSSDDLRKWYPPTFIGSVVLGFITNLPDIFIIIAAALTSSGVLALGALLGGNALAFTLGYFFVIIANAHFNKSDLYLPKDLRVQLTFLVVAAALVLALSLFGAFYFWSGFVMLALFAAYIFSGINGEKLRQGKLEQRLNQFSSSDRKVIRSLIKPNKKQVAGVTLKLATAVFIFTYTASPFVSSIVKLSATLGFPSVYMAALLIPLAAEAPELVSSFVLSKKSSEAASIAVSNMVGSKIQSNTLILGLAVVMNSLLGRNFLIGKHFYFVALLIAVNLYGFKATYDLVLTKRDALFSLLLYPVVIIFMMFV